MTCPDLSKLLPAINTRIDDTLNLTDIVNDVLQPVLQLLCDEADRWVDQHDVDLANEDTVNAMLRDLGNPFEVAFSQPLNRKRLLVRVLLDAYKSKGSTPGLTDVIRALTGIEIVSVISPATIDAWDLGVDVLGDTAADPPPADPSFTDLAILGPSPGFVRYSFQIEVPRVLTQDERDVITEIVGLVKPAHTHFIGFVEPGVVGDIEHWELDVSALHETGEPLIGDEVDLHGP